MTTNQTPLQRSNRIPLNHEQEMSLRYGELAERPAFASEEERRAAWFHHRDRLLRHCNHGQRPPAWWDYECPIPHPRDREYAEAALYEAGLLTESEVAELMAQWRRDFERAQAADFGVCLGPENFLKGPAARKAHYVWAGIPKGLLREWKAQHRRRGKTTRELETTAAEHPAA